MSNNIKENTKPLEIDAATIDTEVAKINKETPVETVAAVPENNPAFANSQALSDEIQTIQAAIEAGDDPIEELETAAGLTSHGGSSSAVEFAREAHEVTASSKFETEEFILSAQNKVLIDTNEGPTTGTLVEDGGVTGDVDLEADNYSAGDGSSEGEGGVQGGDDSQGGDNSQGDGSSEGTDGEGDEGSAGDSGSQGDDSEGDDDSQGDDGSESDDDSVGDDDTTDTDQPSITTADVNSTREDITLTVPAENGVLSNDSDPDSALAVATFTVAGDGTVFDAGSSATITDIGEFTLNCDGSYAFVPVYNYSGEVPVVTYTTNTGVSETLTLFVTPVADNLGDNAAVVIGDEEIIDYSVTEDKAHIDGNKLSLDNGITAQASGNINISHGLGIGVSNSSGIDENNEGQSIDVGDTLEFVFPEAMQGITAAFKDTQFDIVSIESQNIQLLNDTVLSGEIAAFEKNGKQIQDFDSAISVTLSITYNDGGTEEFAINDVSDTWSIDLSDVNIENIESSVLSWNVTGTLFNGGEGTLALTVNADLENAIFSNSGSYGKQDANGYQLFELAFSPGETATHTYPVDINAIPVDTDSSEIISDVYLSGLPEGASIKVVTTDDDGSTTETEVTPTLDADGNTIFVLDPSLLSNEFDDNGEVFNDQLYLTTSDKLAEDFTPTIAITTTDTAGDISDQAYTILGGSESTTFTGSDGEDYIDGGAGDDTLTGGAGNDILIGGDGADTFVWLEGDTGTDHVRDFNITKGDKLDLSDLLDVQSGDNLNEFLDFSSDGADTTIAIHAGGADAPVTQTIILDDLDLGSDDLVIINNLFDSDNSGALIVSDDTDVNTTLEIADIPDES